MRRLEWFVFLSITLSLPSGAVAESKTVKGNCNAVGSGNTINCPTYQLSEPTSPAIPQVSHPAIQPSALNGAQRIKILVEGFWQIKDELKSVQLVRVEGVGVTTYFMDLLDAFSRIGQPRQRFLTQPMTNPDQTGVIVEVANKDKPPPLAVTLLRIFSDAQVPAKIEGGHGSGDFVEIFCGEPDL